MQVESEESAAALMKALKRGEHVTISVHGGGVAFHLPPAEKPKPVEEPPPDPPRPARGLRRLATLLLR